MKRLFSILIVSGLCLSAAFAGGFFEKRYFEIQMKVPVNLSNNIISLDDVLKKEVVIDLNEIAKKTPKDGLVLNASAYPEYAMHLQVANVFVGLSTGVDVYDRLGVSRDLIDFLGNGNQIGDSIDVALNNSADAFFHVDLDVGIKNKKTNIHVKPSVFLPIASMNGDMGKVSFLNDADGNITAKMHADINFHSLVDFSDPTASLSTDLGKCFGFDIAASYKKELNRKSAYEIAARIPIVPGKLNYLSNFTMDFDYSMNIMDFGNATSNSSNSNDSRKTDPYKINRPMKVNAYYDYALMGKMLSLRGGLGFGVYHPFVDGAVFYPEYYLGSTFNLIDLFKCTLSTEYTDRIFKNQLGLTLNLRIIQVDAGASLQAADFTKSFAGTGYGAYVMFTTGF